MNPETNMFENIYTEQECEICQRLQTLKQGRLHKSFAVKTGLEKTKGQLYRADGSVVPDHWSIFTIGQEIPINGYIFRVAYIGETSILFEPIGPIEKTENT
jgi:hypothetical protein